LAHFQNTYIDTSKITVEFAKPQGDETIPRAWSRHTVGTTAYKLTHKESQQHENKRQQKLSEKEIEDKKNKFRDFLKVVGVKDKNNGQSWNDSFQEFMNPDGPL
jgi:multiple RNA-binding domain-containing protein 1